MSIFSFLALNSFLSDDPLRDFSWCSFLTNIYLLTLILQLQQATAASQCRVRFRTRRPKSAGPIVHVLWLDDYMSHTHGRALLTKSFRTSAKKDCYCSPTQCCRVLALLKTSRLPASCLLFFLRTSADLLRPTASRKKFAALAPSNRATSTAISYVRALYRRFHPSSCIVPPSHFFSYL